MQDETAAAALPPCPYCGRSHGEATLKCPKTDMVLPLRGRLLDGKFRLNRKLGKGGMASVWLATNTRVDREVAIKLIRPEVLRNDDLVARFSSEAKAAGRIGHTNVCEILDFGIGPVGPYIVMEHLRGQNLAELLGVTGPLPAPRIASIVSAALQGLDAAHRSGIVHRDLKPENVFLHVPNDGDPVVKLMDFGVAKFTDGSNEIETAHGALLGTPEYMAPEQFRGASLAEPRTDVWAIGAILYRAVTGQHAFKGPTVAATLMMVTHEPPTDVRTLAPDLPEALAAIIDRCLSKPIEDRFADVAALDAALREAVVLEPLTWLSALLRPEEGPARLPPHAAEREAKPLAHEAITLSQSDVGTGEGSGPPRQAHTPVRAAPPSSLPDPVLGNVGLSSQDATLPIPATPPEGGRFWGRRIGVIIAFAALCGVGWWMFVQSTRQPVDAPPVGGDASVPTAVDDVVAEATAPKDLGTPPLPTDADRIADVALEGPTTDAPEDAVEILDAGVPPADDGATVQEPSEPDLDPGPDSTPELTPTKAEPATDVPAGLVIVGTHVASLTRGKRSNQGDARKYCEALSLTGHQGLKGWKLPYPGLVKDLVKADGLGTGRYWTSARWKNRVQVFALPSGRMTSADATKKLARTICVTRWPG